MQPRVDFSNILSSYNDDILDAYRMGHRLLKVK